RAIIEQEIRSTIIRILRAGVESENNNTKRHALCAKELLVILETKLGTPIKLTNVYFHLQKLVDQDFLKIVATPMEGKHHISYYGISAKFFLFKDQQRSTDKRKKTLKQLADIVLHLNKGIARKEIIEIIDKFEASMDMKTERIVSWIKKHEATLISLEIDFSDMHFLLQEILAHDSKNIELAGKLLKLLALER
ncbi:MAG: hypothetical protein ACTSP4_17480, partial [Candidatus Hodarchaeales archaeon]